MSAPVVPSDASLEEILDENSYILGELASHTITIPYIPQFDAFQQQWAAASAARVLLVIAVGKANGRIGGVDDTLDDFVDTLDRNLLIAVKNDREAPLYTFYFGAKPPHLLKRPILSEELATVRTWVTSLQTSPIAAIAALAPQLAQIVADADAAVAELQAAEAALKEFDTIGQKKALIDGFNALRQKVWGELSAKPHEQPAAMLPASFADRFFRHFSRSGLTSQTNPADVQKRIDSLTKGLDAAKAHLKTLEDKAAERAQKKAAAEAAKAALEKAKQEKADAAQKAKDAEKAYQDALKK